jgi:hypothetical protein
VVYARKKFAPSPMGCHWASEGRAVDRIAFPLELWVVMCRWIGGRSFGFGFGGAIVESGSSV